jgi:N-acetylmuramoyl-L-alanine amidase
LEKGTNRWADQLLNQSPNKPAFTYGANPDKPLQGLRVALDPGHLAHNMKMAEIEGKYVKMKSSRATKGKRITFFEAAHTLATAHFLKEKLETMGASVFMTRKQLDDYPMGMSFSTWKKTEAKAGLEEALAGQYIDSTRAELVRKGKVTPKQHFTWVYNQLDLRKRAAAINAWRPDLTVIIHYNITQAAWQDRTRRGFFPAAKDNFSMAFTPGSFMQGELSRPIDRISFARLLLSSDINRSVAVSSKICDEFHNSLKVPYVTSESPTSYIERACVYAGEPGVYARNLTLSRLVASPLVYGESLCQEFPSEAMALSKTSLEIAGIPTSERVAQVAEAYMAGILNWLKKD